MYVGSRRVSLKLYFSQKLYQAVVEFNILADGTNCRAKAALKNCAINKIAVNVLRCSEVKVNLI